MKLIVDIKAENVGSEAASTYIFAVEPAFASKIAFVQGQAGKTNQLFTREVKLRNAPEGARFFQIALHKSVGSGETVHFKVRSEYANVLRPVPAVVKQGDPLYVQYVGNYNYYSVYPVLSLNTNFKCGARPLSVVTEGSHKISGGLIEFTGMSDRPAFDNDSVTVHYELSVPMIKFTKARKDVEISHWGNVAIEEHIDIRNDGPKQIGEFSRVDYMRNSQQHHSPTSFRRISGDLPAGAYDIYYRDLIGNISTSHVRDEDEKVHIDLLTRFPMQSGWKTDFYYGYSLHSNSAIFRNKENPNQFYLDISFATPFDEAVIDDYCVRIILPEGASNIKIVTPFAVDDEYLDTHMGYLDVFGRHVVVLKKTNVVSWHHKNFQVVYDYVGLARYYKPILLVLGFFLFFAISSVLFRLDLSLTDRKKNASESKKTN